MDVEGSLDLAICLRELLQELRVDRHGLDLILEAVEKSLRMTSEVIGFQHFQWSEKLNMD
jgi:hypothetical protein